MCLQYPDKKDENAIRTKPSFADCLRDSLKTSGEVRAWCEGHKAYTRMFSARHPKALPQVMSVNLGMRDPDDLRWWGVNVDTINSHTKEAAAPIKTQWLPHYLHVHVSGNDSNSDSNSNDVTVTQSLADDLDQLETCDGGVTYELTALACLARRPAEEVSAYSLALLYFVVQPLSSIPS